MIVELGRTLHLEIVAEGIEREDQLVRLRRLACKPGQGFYFGMPMSPAEMDALIRADLASRAA